MAVGDLRIYNLTDTQEDYSSSLYVVVDNSGFSNSKKMLISDIYPLINTLDSGVGFNSASSEMRLNNGSGVEEKVTVDEFLSNPDVIVTLKDNLGLGSIAWFDGSPVYGGVVGGTFICKATEYNGVVYFSGQLNTASAPGGGVVIFSLPAEVGVCTEDWYFSAADDSVGNELNSEFKVVKNTRDVVAVSSSIATNVESVFGTSYPVI